MIFLEKFEIKNDIIFIPKVCPICNSHNANNLRPIVDFKYSIINTLKNFRIRHFILGVPICQNCLEKEQKALLFIGAPSIIFGFIIGYILSSFLSQIHTLFNNPILPFLLSVTFLLIVMRYHPSFLSTWFRLYPNSKSTKVTLFIRNESYLRTLKKVNEDYSNWNTDISQNKGNNSNIGTLKKVISSVGMFLKSTPLAYQYLCPVHNIQITVGIPASNYKQCPKCGKKNGILFIVSDSVLNIFKK